MTNDLNNRHHLPAIARCKLADTHQTHNALHDSQILPTYLFIIHRDNGSWLPLAPFLFPTMHLAITTACRDAFVALGCAASTQAVGSGYWRMIGTTKQLIEKAEAIGQSWLKGIGISRQIQKA